MIAILLVDTVHDGRFRVSPARCIDAVRPVEQSINFPSAFSSRTIRRRQWAGDLGGAAAYRKVAMQHDVRKDRSTAMLDGNMPSNTLYPDT